MATVSSARPVRSRRTVRIAAVLLTVAAGVVPVISSLPAHAIPSAGPVFNYAEALQKAVWFYDAQRLGRLPANNRVSWRGDSFLTDGTDASLDLVGGFADAGDTIKATYPLAHTLTTLAWSMIEAPQGYTNSGQSTYLLSNLRWGMDYLIRAHPAANRLVAEVADPGLDHRLWAAAEVQNYPRQTYFINSSCWGSDLAMSTAAAFASASMVFRTSDPTYANTLLTHAQQLWSTTESLPKVTYHTCVPIITEFYKSWSGFNDELVWGSLWLYRATGTQSYLDRALAYYPNMPKQDQGANSPIKYGWTYDWDDKTASSYILLAALTGNTQALADSRNWADFNAGAGVNGQKLNPSPGGQAFYGNWGSLRYSAGAAFIAFLLADSGRLDATRNQQLHDFAVRQVNYILGDNPSSLSYMVGFGANFVRRPHHRTAHGSWTDHFYQPVENRHTLYGALIGGPKQADDNYGPEDRNDFQKAEVALDYNAGLTGALARMVKEYGGTPLANFPIVETPTDELSVDASVNQANPNFIEIKSLLYNRTAWPARVTSNLQLRYFFNLAPATSPSQIILSKAFMECGNPAGPTQFSATIYYVTINCAGQQVAPIGQTPSRRENQFRITWPAAHDYTQDWSFLGVSPNQATPTPAPRIVMLDGTTLVWGTPPGPATPPGAPGQPTVTGRTSTSVSLAWTASTPGSSPIAGYDVYRVATPTDVKVATVTGLSTTVTNLTPSTSYTFYVKAVDTGGTASAASPSTTTSTLPPPTPPGAPGQPTASNVAATSLTLTWTAATAGTNPIGGYQVYRVATPSDVLVASTNATTLTTPVTGLTPSTNYTFYVRALDNTGVAGPNSTPRTVMTAAAVPPTAPGTPVASGLTATSVTLTWTASTAGGAPLARYEVYRVGTPEVLMGQTANATTLTLTLTTLTPSTAYTFFVRARDTAGVASANSDTVPVTTPAPPAATLKAQHKNNDSSPTDNQIKPGLSLVNGGTSAVALSTVTIRYYFTGEAGATSYSTWCDHASIGCGNVTHRVVALATPVTGADRYLEIGFAPAAGNLAAGANIGEIQARFNKTDWSAFNEVNDYSYGTNTAFADATRVTVFVSGALVWGTPPT